MAKLKHLKAKNTAAIPLSKAALCLDCEVIYQGVICPVCGYGNRWPVDNWLSANLKMIERLYEYKREGENG